MPSPTALPSAGAGPAAALQGTGKEPSFYRILPSFYYEEARPRSMPCLCPHELAQCGFASNVKGLNPLNVVFLPVQAGTLQGCQKCAHMQTCLAVACNTGQWHGSHADTAAVGEQKR